MSDLTRERDHARTMAATGPAEDAALWTQLADEIDQHIARKAGLVLDLFGEAAVEPEPEEAAP